MSEIAQTADHALRILEELGKGNALTSNELGEGLALSRTVVHRLLRTLAARGFVLREGNRYRPGPSLVRLAAVAQPDLRSIAAPTMEQLSQRIGETVVLHVADRAEAIVVDQVVATTHVVQVSHRIGSKSPLGVGASGLALLSLQPDSVKAKVVRRAEDPERIEKSLALVASTGYALSRDELQIGVLGIAAPVRGQHDEPICSLAILVPSGRAGDLTEFAPDLLGAATELRRRFLRVS